MSLSKKYIYLITVTVALLFIGNCIPTSVNGKQDVSPILTLSSNETINDYLELLLIYRDSNYYYLQSEIKHLYELNKYQPIWFDDDILNRTAQMFLDTISQSHSYGLHPDFYPTLKIKSNLLDLQKLKSKSLRLHKIAETELLITASAIEFFTHLQFGIVRGKIIWNSENEGYLRNKVMAAFYQLADNQPINKILTDIQPKSLYYKKLSGALKRFVLPEEWPEAETVLRLNEKSQKDVLTIMKLTGFFNGNIDYSDSQYKLILNSYQNYYNLPERNFMGPITRDHIINDIFNQYKIMSVNIERLRQNPPLVNNYLWVNIPSYNMSVFENNKRVKDIRVIVGAAKTPTPVLSGCLTHILTYPQWNIPPSIVSKEIIPAIKRDSLYLQRKGYYITDWSGEVLDQQTTNIDSYTHSYFPFNIAQDPGPSNALGTLKFIFDNDYNIYLHDTNARYLFNRKDRAMSHGCIRVENPDELAKYLLSDQESARLNYQMRNKKTGYLFIEKHVSVYIRYITCEASNNGSVTYYNDIYNLDHKDWIQMIKSLYFNAELSSSLQMMTDGTNTGKNHSL